MTSGGGAAGEIDDEAARWAIRVDGRDLDRDPDAELQQWLAGDARRAGAFLRAQAALSLADRVRALPETAPASPRPTLSRRGLIAAGAAVAAGGGAFAFLAARPEAYSTALGEIRRVPLHDGSVAEINTQSALTVSLTPRLRHVRLQRGEAWFNVAKDVARPFMVEAGGFRVQALGTAFSVHRTEAGIEVLVTEGVVQAWRKDQSAAPARLEAGSRLTVGADGRLIVAPDAQAVERSLAWRSGQIMLDGRTLAEAAAEFNRYNARRIVIDDPVVAREGLVGLFQTNDPESFARSVAAALGARLSETASEIRIGPGQS